jgi:hypothetical protein
MSFSAEDVLDLIVIYLYSLYYIVIKKYYIVASQVYEGFGTVGFHTLG